MTVGGINGISEGEAPMKRIGIAVFHPLAPQGRGWRECAR